MFERYAIFYTPCHEDQDGLADIGAQWLGWDSAAGIQVPHLALSGKNGAPIDIANTTETPRKYGFHGTLKAPFYLAPGEDEAAIHAAAKVFAKTHAPVVLDGLELSHLRGFIALRPIGDVRVLNAFAADITRDFDRLRAPLSAADIERRRKANLTAQQDKQMLDWGYPYIFEDFHFHMTLSGSLPEGEAGLIADALKPLLAPRLTQPYTLDAITVMGQDAAGMFHQIHRYTLAG